ncbi:hypothetical protein LguiB_034709 [Lonicera macranthoides]
MQEGSFRVASTFYEKTDKKGRVRGKATDKPFFTRLSTKPGFYRVRELYYGLGRSSPPSLHSTSLFFFFISIAIAIAIVASPHPDRGTLPWELALGIVKLWMSIIASGEKVSFLDLECHLELNEDFGELGFSENELVPINVSFIGKCHVVVEENPSFGQFNSPEGKKSGMRRISSGGNMRGEGYGDVDDVIVLESGSSGSLPDRLMSDLYQYFANRTSPSGDRASRRQRRREKERQGRRKWEPEHFVKIVN